MKRFFLIILILSINCSDKDWTIDRRKNLQKECIEDASKQMFDKKEIHDICSCVVENFVKNFSWQEYQKMIAIKITSQNNPELSNRLEIHISSVMKDCDISL